MSLPPALQLARPPGADAVVPVEWTDGGVSAVSIRKVPTLGQHVRRAGEEAPVGATLLQAGTFLGAAQIALIAATNRAAISCRPRPRVVVVSTGSELVETGEPLAHGQIPDSNSHMLMAACRESGAMAYRVGMVPDDPAALLDPANHAAALALITADGVALEEMTRLADDVRAAVVGDEVTYVVNRNINFSNVCYVG